MNRGELLSLKVSLKVIEIFRDMISLCAVFYAVKWFDLSNINVLEGPSGKQHISASHWNKFKALLWHDFRLFLNERVSWILSQNSLFSQWKHHCSTTTRTSFCGCFNLVLEESVKPQLSSDVITCLGHATQK